MSIFLSSKNSKKQGDVGLAYCIAYCVKLGTISIPLTDSQDYDLLLDTNGKDIFRIQVKTTNFKTPCNIYAINLSVKGGNQSYNTVKQFDNTKVDYVFALTGDGTEYMIPSSEILVKNNLNLGKKYNKFIVSRAETTQDITFPKKSI